MEAVFDVCPEFVGLTAEDGPIAEAASDELADSYAAGVRTNAYNAELTFPATASLVPDLDGKRALGEGRRWRRWRLDGAARADGAGWSPGKAMASMDFGGQFNTSPGRIRRLQRSDPVVVGDADIRLLGAELEGSTERAGCRSRGRRPVGRDATIPVHVDDRSRR